MMQRVADLLPRMPVDSGAARFIRSATGSCAGTPPCSVTRSDFTIMDREDPKDLINTVVASAGIDPKEMRFPKAEVLAEIFSFA